MDTQIQESNQTAYSDLLQRPEWFAKREIILKRDGNHCLNCGSSNNLQVHHRQYHKIKCINDYKKPWDYKDRYLVTLCMNCHQVGHKYFKVPVFNV